MAELPAGTYGFILPFARDEAPYVAGDVSRRRQPFEIEIHKLADGEIRLVGYASGERAATLAADAAVGRMMIYPTKSEGSPALVSISVRRLGMIRTRELGDGSYVYDVELRQILGDAKGRTAARQP